MLLGALAAMTASPLFGAEDPLQPVTQATWYHRRITEDAALATGWAPHPAAELAWHALGVDLYAYHLLWRLAGGPARRRGAHWGRHALARLHFDNLPTAADVDETWRRILGGTRVAIEWAAANEDTGAARGAIGAGLHAVQDFYSHSTWIDAERRRTTTWLDSRGQPTPPDLCTGGVTAGHAAPLRHGDVALTGAVLLRLPGMLGRPASPRHRPHPPASPARLGPPPGMRLAGPAGINLDSRWQAQVGVRARRLHDLDGDQAFDLALALAARDTRTWLTELDSWFAAGPHRAFWQQVLTGPATDWTSGYNTADRLPYQFLTAGRPLPAGRGDSARWFLRIERPAGARGRTAVHVLGPHDRLLGIARPPGHAVTSGPLPADATTLRIVRTGPPRPLRIHAFRRAPDPVLRTLLDERANGLHPGHDLPLDLDRDPDHGDSAP